jgi:hypothetical protein
MYIGTPHLHSISFTCNNHQALYGGTASASAKGCKYADIYVVRIGGQQGGSLTANGVNIFQQGKVHKNIPITNDKLTLNVVYAGGGGETAIDYIYFHN